MKKKIKAKAMVNGTEQEVEVELDFSEVIDAEVRKALKLATPEEIAATHTPKDVFQAELDRRVSSITKGMYNLEDLKNKPELRQQVFDALGVKVDEKGNAKMTADQMAQLQEEWRKKELAPVAQRAEQAEGKAKSLLDRIRDGDIVQAAAEARIAQHLLKPVAEGAPVPIVTMLKDVFAYSDEHDSFFVRKGKDGFEFSSDPKNSGKPYKNIREFVKEWAAKKENEPFIDVKAPGAPHQGEPGATGGTAVIQAPGDRPLTLQEYQAAETAAGGGRVVVKTGAEG